MSEHQQFLQEKSLVDQYIQAGYEICSVKEDLSGMHIEFNTSKKEGNNSVMVLITTADARKYVSTKMFFYTL